MEYVLKNSFLKVLLFVFFILVKNTIILKLEVDYY